MQQNRTCRLLLTCKGAKEPGRRKHNLAHEKPRKDFEQSSKNEACFKKFHLATQPDPHLLVVPWLCQQNFEGDKARGLLSIGETGGSEGLDQ